MNNMPNNVLGRQDRNNNCGCERKEEKECGCNGTNNQNTNECGCSRRGDNNCGCR